MLQRVRQQIPDGSPELVRVGRHGGVGVDLDVQSDPVGVGDRPHVRCGIAREVSERDRLTAQGELSRIDPRDREEIVDETIDAVDLTDDLREEPIGVGGETVLQSLRLGADAGEREPEVVSDADDEFLPGRLLPVDPLSGAAQTGIRRREFRQHVAEFSDRKCGGRCRQGSADSHISRGVAQRARRTAHPRAEQHRDRDRHDAAGDRDGDCELHIRFRQIHRLRGHEHTPHDREDGRGDEGDHVQHELRAGEDPQERPRDGTDDRSHAGGAGHDEEDIGDGHSTPPRSASVTVSVAVSGVSKR